MASFIPSRTTALGLGLAAALSVAACGSSKSSSPPSAAGGATPSPGSGALAADAKSAATGDIPDNQAFLTFADAGWSMKYPEGWTRAGGATTVTFTDKNNQVRVSTARGAPPSVAAVTGGLQALQRNRPSFSFSAPQPVALPADPSALKARYTTQSAPNPVTGKRVMLIVDRYVLRHGPLVATVDLGTPTGVDNVDAYRMMIRSFRWR